MNLTDDSSRHDETWDILHELEPCRKKLRTSFSKSQLEKLEASFGRRKYLTVKDRVFLSNTLKLSDVQIKTWYQNRRSGLLSNYVSVL